MRTLELPAPPPPQEQQRAPAVLLPSRRRVSSATLRQFLRFGLVGGLNTAIDLLVLNCLLWFHPTQNIGLLLLDNSIAYSFGAVNSFLLNKYWTFQRGGRAEQREIGRFALTTLAGIACNNFILWMISRLLRPVFLQGTLWANASKVAAIGGTVLISYLAMRLWVFAQHAQEPTMNRQRQPI